MLTVLLSPYMPESTAKLLAALGDERIELSAAEFGDGAGGGGGPSRRAPEPSCFPQALQPAPRRPTASGYGHHR